MITVEFRSNDHLKVVEQHSPTSRTVWQFYLAYNKLWLDEFQPQQRTSVRAKWLVHGNHYDRLRHSYLSEASVVIPEAIKAAAIKAVVDELAVCKWNADKEFHR